MAELKMNVEMNAPRPCYIKGRKGMFHRWVEKEDLLIKCSAFLPSKKLEALKHQLEDFGVVPNGCESERVKNTYALIEFEDGHVEEVPPTTITFFDSDRYFKEYAWEEAQNDGCSAC